MYSPIPVGLPLIAQNNSPPQDQFDTEQGHEQAGLDIREPVKLYSSEIEQIVIQCTKEQIHDFNKQIDSFGTKFEKKL